MKPEGQELALLEFTKAFYIGGTEVQVLELLRGLGPSYRLEVGVLEHVGPLLDEVWQLGMVPKAFPLGGSFVSPWGALQIGRLTAFLREKRIELVHAHDFYSTLLSVPAAKLAGAKVIVGRLDLLHWHGRARATALSALTHMADAVIANAQAVRRHLLEKERIPESKIRLIRNGIDLRRFDEKASLFPEELPDTHGAPVLVHVANMGHSVKRQEDLLAALALARRRVGELHVFFVGDGSRRKELEARAAELGVLPLAHFLGFRRDTPAIQARATVGVLCSSLEGLSNAVIEGMAAKLPMVVTAVGGNPELVEHGVRGLVVPALQPEALADAIVELVSKPEQARQMGEAGRAFVERELTVERLIAEHDSLYRSLAQA